MSRLAAMNRFSTRAWPVVRVALGVLLLTAAVLKLAGRPVSAIPQVGWFATPPVQLAVAEWEIVLGVWLLSGAIPAGAWLASLATFVAFAGASLYLGRSGVSRCGCFGQFEATPWHSLAIDLFAILLLVVARPELSSLFERSASRRWRALMLMASLPLLLTTATVFGSLAYGSTGAMVARLRGEHLSAEPYVVDFGSGDIGDDVRASTAIRNWTDAPVRVVGGTSDCSCITTDDLPLVIMPGESKSIVLRLRLRPGSIGVRTRSAELWTDCDAQRSVRLKVICLVR
jgi:hypothetical protein